MAGKSKKRHPEPFPAVIDNTHRITEEDVMNNLLSSLEDSGLSDSTEADLSGPQEPAAPAAPEVSVSPGITLHNREVLNCGELTLIYEGISYGPGKCTPPPEILPSLKKALARRLEELARLQYELEELRAAG